ncbi:hypothetical protein SEA_GUEY18_5 [Gordonia phage Guey18]|nr:hypothetical protein SEA_GUEY18_5 [Gordonia phage Guey18]
MTCVRKTTYTYTCDRCGYVTERESSLKPEGWSFYAAGRYLNPDNVSGLTQEICQRCTGELQDWQKRK